MKKNKRIIILGDSMTYEKSHLNSFEENYNFFLKKYLRTNGNHDVFLLARAANHCKYQSKKLKILYDLKQFNPDIVIIHLGFPAAAPRLFTESQQFYFQAIPFYLRKSIINFLSQKRYFFTRKFPKVYVPLLEFKYYYQKLLREIKKIGAFPIIINIMKPNQGLIKRSYNIQENIKKYNNILSILSRKNKCPLIDVYKMVEKNPELRWKDGIHLTALGHQQLTRALIKIIDPLL
ncbi:MAG: SGNH/GDSL hydrolase family protein [Promethearchaeota archaeon]